MLINNNYIAFVNMRGQKPVITIGYCAYKNLLYEIGSKVIIINFENQW